jgi:anti-sigma factor RsiW
VDLVREYRGWRHRRHLRIKCQAAVELMTDYLEGDLDDKERQRFEQHLTHCPPCRVILDQMRATIDTVGHVDVDDVDPAVRDDLLALYRAVRDDG